MLFIEGSIRESVLIHIGTLIGYYKINDIGLRALSVNYRSDFIKHIYMKYWKQVQKLSNYADQTRLNLLSSFI